MIIRFSKTLCLGLCVSALLLGAGCGIKPSKLEPPTPTETQNGDDFPRRYPPVAVP